MTDGFTRAVSPDSRCYSTSVPATAASQPVCQDAAGRNPATADSPDLQLLDALPGHGPGGGAGDVTVADLGLDQPPPEAPALLEVTEHIEDSVLLAQLDVGINGDVDTGSAGAVTEVGEN